MSAKGLMKNESIIEVANRCEKAIAQVALRWGVQKGYVLLPKSKRKGCIEENLNMIGWSLTEEEMKRIDELNQNKQVCWDSANIKY